MKKFKNDTQSFTLESGIRFSFPIVFSRGCFAPENSALGDMLKTIVGGKVAVFCDSGLLEAYPQLTQQATDYIRNKGFDCPHEGSWFCGGETSKKSFEVVQQMLAEISRLRLCRHSCVVTIGGGAFLDCSGLAVALAHRGLRLLRMPTTALAQADSGVGVKNGINLYEQKNFAGTFHPPSGVLSDLQFLCTQNPQAILEGIAEAFKVALIKDADFFCFLEQHASGLDGSDREATQHAVIRSAQLHAEHIAGGGDPFETNRARPLDFGHWSAHWLEAASGHTVSHGQAVACGIALDTIYACNAGYISTTEKDRIIQALLNTGMRLWQPLLEQEDANGRRKVLQGLDDFRKHLGGELTITLPHGIGRRIEVHSMDYPLLETSFPELKRHASV